MKKLLLLISVLFLTFSISSCGNKDTSIDGDILQTEDITLEAIESKIEVNVSEPAEGEEVVTWQETYVALLRYYYEPTEGEKVVTWQDAYAALLRYYYEQYGGEYSLHFLLHDIDMDGIPELFISEQGDWVDHIDVVYTFRDGRVISLEFGEDVTFMPHLFSASGPYLTPNIDNAPGVIAGFRGVNSISGGSYWVNLIVIDGYGLVVESRGEWIVEAVSPLESSVGGNDINAIREYTTITINGAVVSEGEFLRVFGYRGSQPQLQTHLITETNIQNIIFGR